MESITLYAREQGSVPANLPNSDRPLVIAFLDVAIPPPVPLRTGQHVRIHALIRRNTPGAHPTSPARFWSEPTDIEGKIVGIRAMELDTIEFVIQNDIYHSPVEHAYLTVKYAPGDTVSLTLWQWATRMALLPFLPRTRTVLMESDVDVAPRAYALPGMAHAEAGREGDEV